MYALYARKCIYMWILYLVTAKQVTWYIYTDMQALVHAATFVELKKGENTRKRWGGETEAHKGNYRET